MATLTQFAQVSLALLLRESPKEDVRCILHRSSDILLSLVPEGAQLQWNQNLE